MNYNPYAAPQAAPQGGPTNQAFPGTPQPWELGEVLGAAWRIFQPNWLTLCLGALITFFGAALVQSVGSLDAIGLVDRGSVLAVSLRGAGFFAGFVVRTFFLAGFTRMLLSAARGEMPQLGELFSGAPVFVPLLIAQLLTSIAIGLGFVFFIVPAFILSAGLAFAQYYVVDQQMGPIEAMKASWAATMGQKVQVFLLLLVVGLLAIAGIFAFCVGMLATISVGLLAVAIVYLRVAGRGGPAPQPYGYGAPQGYGAYPGAAPGYGAPAPGGYPPGAYGQPGGYNPAAGGAPGYGPGGGQGYPGAGPAYPGAGQGQPGGGPGYPGGGQAYPGAGPGQPGGGQGYPGGGQGYPGGGPGYPGGGQGYPGGGPGYPGGGPGYPGGGPGYPGGGPGYPGGGQGYPGGGPGYPGGGQGYPGGGQGQPGGGPGYPGGGGYAPPGTTGPTGGYNPGGGGNYGR